MSHVFPYPYPDLSMAIADAPVAFQAITGGDVEPECGVKAAQTVASYGLSVVFPHEGMRATPSDDLAFSGLNALACEKYGHAVTAGAFNWKAILRMLLEFIIGK